MQILNSPTSSAPFSSSSFSANPTSANPDSTESKSVKQELLSSLSAYLNPVQVDEMVNADPADFSAEKVSSRIADFVAMGLANAASNGASEERLQSLYNSAVEGMRKGFEEAREILEQMPQFTDSVRALVDETEQLSFDKLAKLDPSAGPDEIATNSVTAAMEYRESLKLKLVTQDGDKVEVRFNNRESARFSADDNETRFATESRSSFQLKVVGELDEDELLAIEDLLSQVTEVADSFYAGRVDQAFDMAVELKMDPNELARMDLNMQQSARVEVREYQKVDKQSHPEHPWAQRLQNWLASVEQLTEGFDALFDKRESSLADMVGAAVDVRGPKKGVPPGLAALLAERLA